MESLGLGVLASTADSQWGGIAGLVGWRGLRGASMVGALGGWAVSTACVLVLDQVRPFMVAVWGVLGLVLFVSCLASSGGGAQVQLWGVLGQGVRELDGAVRSWAAHLAGSRHLGAGIMLARSPSAGAAAASSGLGALAVGAASRGAVHLGALGAAGSTRGGLIAGPASSAGSCASSVSSAAFGSAGSGVAGSIGACASSSGPASGSLAGVGARVASSLCGSVRAVVGVSSLGSVASCGLGGLIAGLKLCLRVNSGAAFDVAAGLGGGILARDVLRASGLLGLADLGAGVGPLRGAWSLGNWA